MSQKIKTALCFINLSVFFSSVAIRIHAEARRFIRSRRRHVRGVQKVRRNVFERSKREAIVEKAKTQTN